MYFGQHQASSAIMGQPGNGNCLFMLNSLGFHHVSHLHEQGGLWQNRLAANLKLSLSFCALFSTWDNLDCISARRLSLACGLSQVQSCRVVVRWGRREREKKKGEGLSQKLGTWPNLCIILPLSALLLELLFLTLESHDFLFPGIKRVSQLLASLQCSYNANIAN